MKKFICLILAILFSLLPLTALAQSTPVYNYSVQTDNGRSYRYGTDLFFGNPVLMNLQDYCEIYNKIEEMESDIDLLAKLVYRESRGSGATQSAAVVWCVLNRYDAGYSDTIKGVVTAKHQFASTKSTPVVERLRAIVVDVVVRWLLEKKGYEDVGRMLPNTYLYFASGKKHGVKGNRYREKYRSKSHWDWSLPSPYED